MARALWLADAIRDEGVTVLEVAGWSVRGKPTLDPRVIVCHHTASPAGQDAPALDTVTKGRSDVPGPLCNVLLSRTGVAFIVASGVSNNAGRGSWRGIVGNSRTLGIEAENTGTGEPWPARQMDAYARICAAMCRRTGIRATDVIGHKEWAPTRKIDPTFDMTNFRVKVAARLDRQPPPDPDPQPDIEEDDLPLHLIRIKKTPPGAVFVTDWVRKRPVSDSDMKLIFYPKPAPPILELTEDQVNRIPSD